MQEILVLMIDYFSLSLTETCLYNETLKVKTNIFKIYHTIHLEIIRRQFEYQELYDL